MKKFLYSIYDCVVEINNVELKVPSKAQNLSAGKLLELHNGDFAKIYYGESCTSFFIDSAESVNTKNLPQNLHITRFPNYELYEFEAEKKFEPVFFLSKKFKNGDACVLGRPFYFNIEIGGKHFSQKINNEISNINIIDAKNCFFLRANTPEYEYLLAFHKLERKFYEFCGNVEYGESFVKAVVPKNTLARHGELLEYEITTRNFDLKSQEPIYMNGKPSLVPPFLSHIAFFECVREHDYILARSFLEESFAEKLSDGHFVKFFGEFTKIRPIKEDGTPKIALINNSTAKVFVLKISNGKICDIVEE